MELTTGTEALKIYLHPTRNGDSMISTDEFIRLIIYFLNLRSE